MIAGYLDAGWLIFPIKHRSKLPLTEHGLLDASGDTDQIAKWLVKWPTCGWGLSAGASGLLVVDLDGGEGIEQWRNLAAQHPAPRTLTSRTGGGGYHLVYADPEGVGRNSAGLLAPRVDTRGRGGYIVLPPSIHPNGTPYQWARRAPIASAPEWLLAELRPKPLPRLPAPPRLPMGDGESAFGKKTLEGILDRLARAADHERHNLNYWAGVRAGQLYAAGHVQSSALDAVIATAQSVRRDQGRAERDSREGFAWGSANPGGQYPVSTFDLDPPRSRAPRVFVPR